MNHFKLPAPGSVEAELPLVRLLASEDIEILREVCAALCNLAFGDENKFEIAKCGAVPPLITHMQSEDMQIASQSCACLATLAEMPENQEILAKEGAIRPCIAVMRSRYERRANRSESKRSERRA